jgi:hypothetical protein
MVANLFELSPLEAPGLPPVAHLSELICCCLGDARIHQGTIQANPGQLQALRNLNPAAVGDVELQ